VQILRGDSKLHEFVIGSGNSGRGHAVLPVTHFASPGRNRAAHVRETWRGAGGPPIPSYSNCGYVGLCNLIGAGRLASLETPILGAIGHGVEAHESVPLALFALLDAPSEFGRAVLNGIKLGGDTDSIGAMTGSLAGALFGDVGIPSAWLASLENRKRGRDHAVGLADELFALWSALRSERELGEARDQARRARRHP
jgi:hypothetical protein